MLSITTKIFALGAASFALHGCRQKSTKHFLMGHDLRFAYNYNLNLFVFTSSDVFFNYNFVNK